MAKLLDIRTYENRRINPQNNKVWGKTSILEALEDIPFNIKRVFYIYGTSTAVIRGGHRLKKTIQGLVCLQGKYEIFVDNSTTKRKYILDTPSKILVLDNKDWHTMQSKTPKSILLVLSSRHYDVNDYIDEPYPTTPKKIVDKLCL
ncbi:MAG: FdtA/QdtA family cupin domain-containing protein [Patescibacteria group bacterium]